MQKGTINIFCLGLHSEKKEEAQTRRRNVRKSVEPTLKERKSVSISKRKIYMKTDEKTWWLAGQYYDT